MRLVVCDAERHADLLADYQLADDYYTAHPLEVVAMAEADSERYPLLMVNAAEQLVGFFCLHVGAGPAGYGFSGQYYGLIRALSIDDRYRRQGYGVACFRQIFELLAPLDLSSVSHLILAVNEKNTPAQALYEKSGFTVIKRGVQGVKGPQLLMGKSADIA